MKKNIIVTLGAIAASLVLSTISAEAGDRHRGGYGKYEYRVPPPVYYSSDYRRGRDCERDYGRDYGRSRGDYYASRRDGYHSYRRDTCAPRYVRPAPRCAPPVYVRPAPRYGCDDRRYARSSFWFRF